MMSNCPQKPDNQKLSVTEELKATGRVILSNALEASREPVKELASSLFDRIFDWIFEVLSL